MPTPLNFAAEFADSPTAIVGSMDLEGRIYVVRFWPSVRANDNKGAWYVDLFRPNGSPTLLGVKLILSTDLWGGYRTTVEDIPPGRFVVRRTDGVDDEPRPTRKGERGADVATLGSPRLVVEYVSTSEDAAT